MKVFIDADSILFKAACVGKAKGTEDRYLDTMEAVARRADETIKQTISDCFADEAYLAVKGKGNFRYDIFPEYKASRKEGKPMGENLRARLNHAYQHCLDKWSAVPADGMEADDLVCIWAYEAREAEDDWVLAHIDKDLKQIAGTHYNYDSKEIYFVDDDTADWHFCIQLLIGDSGDGIPQLKRGLGVKTAEKLLAGTSYDNRIDVIVDQYRRLFGRGWEDRLNLIGNLLWMKRTWSEELEWNYEDRIGRQSDECESDVLEEEYSDEGLSRVSDSDGASNGRVEAGVREGDEVQGDVERSS